MKRLILGLAVTCLSPSVGAAQGEEPVDATVVSELVVRPATPGPAWWRVADADSAVYVLILPDVTVKGEAWDRSVLERRMAGANLFILPHALSVADPRNIAGMAGLVAQSPKLLFAPKPKMQKKDPGRAALETLLPAETRERFVVLRTSAAQPAERYAALSPIQAGRLLETDYRAHLGLSGGPEMFGGPMERDIESLAKRNHVKVVAAWKIVIPPMKLTIGHTDEPTLDKQVECLGGAVDRIVDRGQRDRKTYMAWREGDVRPLLKPARYPTPKGCEGATLSMSAGMQPSLVKAEESFVADQATAIERALKLPGRSVAVLDPLSPLGNVELGMLGKRGVLERLKAKGYVVTAPDVLSDD